MENGPTRRRPAVAVVLTVLLGLILFGIWLAVGSTSPPTVESILGHPVPATAKVLGTHQWYNTPGNDSLSWAVLDIGQPEFDQLCKDAGYSRFAGDASQFFQSKSDQPSLKWWSLPNLPDSTVFFAEKKTQDGTSQHYVKYEGGKMYVVRSVYGTR